MSGGTFAAIIGLWTVFGALLGAGGTALLYRRRAAELGELKITLENQAAFVDARSAAAPLRDENGHVIHLTGKTGDIPVVAPALVPDSRPLRPQYGTRPEDSRRRAALTLAGITDPAATLDSPSQRIRSAATTVIAGARRSASDLIAELRAARGEAAPEQAPGRAGRHALDQAPGSTNQQRVELEATQLLSQIDMTDELRAITEQPIVIDLPHPEELAFAGFLARTGQPFPTGPDDWNEST